MADSLPSGPRPAEALPGAEDDARIEHLLVTGLDHYFAGEFEPAINLWTRVLFLDRNHDRARAYIERARSAQAEQLRASEALVHEGLEAFGRGDVARARALLSDALEQGASHDSALAVLGRIDRLDVGHPRVPAVPPAARRRPFSRTMSVAAPDTRGRGRAMRVWAAMILVAGLGAGVVVWVVPDAASPANWWPGGVTGERSGVAALTVAPLPVPAPTEAYLSLGRELLASGKLRDALRAVDQVPLGDSLRPDADRLRGQIQRELLAVAAIDVPSPATAGSLQDPLRE